MTIYKVLHVESGQYLGSKAWNHRLSDKGEFYTTMRRANAALYSSLNQGDKHGYRMSDFKILEFDCSVSAEFAPFEPQVK